MPVKHLMERQDESIGIISNRSFSEHRGMILSKVVVASVLQNPKHNERISQCVSDLQLSNSMKCPQCGATCNRRNRMP